MPELTAFYARLSRYVADQTSTERQLRDEKKFADLYGLPAGHQYVDIDLSAYKRVHRPAYEQMLSDIQAGLISHVLIWKIDRVARNLTEFMRFQNLCDQHSVTVRSVNDPYDTSTPIGRAIVQILAVFAELESATISMRVRSAKDLAASKGTFAGGGHRAFGLTADRTALVEDEAAAIRAAAERILAGEAANTIVKEWQAAGVVTPTGKLWRNGTFSNLMTSPHIAGLRTHQGEVIGEASWPAIVDRTTWEALRGLYGSRTRAVPRRSYLLSGLLACGRCGGKLGAHIANGKRNYACYGQPNSDGCGRLSITADPVEAYVTTAALGALSAPEVRRALAHPKNGDGNETQILGALRAAEGRMRELGEEYGKGLPMSAFLSATTSLEREIADLERRLAKAAENSRVVMVGPDPQAEWEKRDLTWRAALVAALFDVPIVVVPGRGSAAERVRLIPRP